MPFSTFFKLLLTIVILPVFVFAKTKTELLPQMPDPEASGREYLRLIEQRTFVLSTSDPLQVILGLGKRNLQWLDFMNSTRPDADKIRFTKPGQLNGIPIDKPSEYGEKTVLADYAKLQQDMPESMRKILLNGDTFTQNPPLDVEEYIKWGKKTDRLYQYTARWIGMKPWLGVLEKRRENDVRGLYFLGKVQNLKDQLQNFASLTEEIKAQYREWLESMCINNFGVRANCADKVARAEKANQLAPFYDSNAQGSQETWNGFFKIAKSRDDIEWNNQNQAVAKIPFQDPKNNRILNFLQVNIEDEWKTAIWNLRLDFQNTNSDIARVEFQAGVTPHVNGLAGNVITMDANTPIDEWDVQWTIRHEFGHVLGFPDCYVEFYVPEREVIVNYQLDVTNLMCSRAGKLQDKHYQEMKRVYYKN